MRKMNVVTIRRPIVPVLGVWILGLCGFFYFFYNAFSHRTWTLLFLAVWALSIPVVFLIDYLVWEVSFTKNNIQFRRLLSKHCYSYSEIKDVKEYFRSVDSQYKLIIRFADGRSISILSGYNNYMNARKELLRHTSFHS